METITESPIEFQLDTPQDRPLVAQPPAPRSLAATSSTATPADLLRYAMDSGADLDRLERLMDLQFKWEQREAEKAFADAMAAFKQNPPQIIKDKHVHFETSKGATNYDHATIGNVTQTITAALADHGFSHRWITAQREGWIGVTCRLTHKLGHFEDTFLEAPPDQSGGKNLIQSIVSTQTYLQRHTLLAATGLATHDQPDDDGRSTRDTSLQDEWIGYANAALTPEVLADTWKRGLAAIRPTGDMQAYEAFKAAVHAKGEALKGAAQ